MPEKLGDIAHAQASHEIEPMHFDRSDADVQVAGDFTVGHPLGHETKDFFLTRREGMRRIVLLENAPRSIFATPLISPLWVGLLPSTTV